MCGSFATQRLSWREIVTLSRLSSHEALPEFPNADRYPMRKCAKAVTTWNMTPIIREHNGIREAIDAAIELARGSNGEILAIDPPEPLSAA